jgi:colanic acid biosynthesis glycosyl transferase WcaI
VHFIGLVRGLSGFVVPSRLYGVLSVGRPVIVAADEDSETAQVVRQEDCGIVIPAGRPELLAGAIRDVYEGKYPLDEMGGRGREYALREADRSVAIERYRSLLANVSSV